MKGNAESDSFSADTVEHICALLGNSKVSEVEGKIVIKPANADDLAKAVSAAMSAGATVSPLSRKGTHTEGDVLIDMSDMNALVDIDKDAQTVRAQARPAGSHRAAQAAAWPSCCQAICSAALSPCRMASQTRKRVDRLLAPSRTKASRSPPAGW